MVRFIENHDEPRAAATFPDGMGRAASVAILTLPGARLLHEGQFEGERCLVIINFSNAASQALVRVPWDELKDTMWRLDDRPTGDTFERSGFVHAGSRFIC